VTTPFERNRVQVRIARDGEGLELWCPACGRRCAEYDLSDEAEEPTDVGDLLVDARHDCKPKPKKPTR